MDRIFYNFKIPRNLYKDLSSQATWHHNSISEEIRERLNITLTPAYEYNHKSTVSTYTSLNYKIRNGALNRYITSDDYITFDFEMAEKTETIFKKIGEFTGYKLQTLELNKDIIFRLAYTMMDPFYENFR